MTSSILDAKPEDIDTEQKRAGYRVCIIGCQRNSIRQACLLAKAGYKVTCTDTNLARIKQLMDRKDRRLNRQLQLTMAKHMRDKKLNTTDNVKEAVSESDIILIAATPKIVKNGKIDYLNLEKACRQAGKSLKHRSLVIITGVVGIGTVEGVVKETIENTSGLKAGRGFGLAYSPLPPSDEETIEGLSNQERIVASADKDSLSIASSIIESTTRRGVMSTENVRTAEAARLFEAAQHCVNTSLAHEFAVLSEEADIDYLEATKLAGSSTENLLYAPRLDYEVLLRETQLLIEEAENLSLKIRLPAATARIGKNAIRHAVVTIAHALRACDKPLRRARISILGISRTRNMGDAAKVTARKIADLLNAKGARISLYDPYTQQGEPELGYPLRKTLKEATENVDCVVILTGHSRFKRLNLKRLALLARMPAAIVDFDGVINPDKAEKEGFKYRGIGRGIWRK